MKWVVKDIDDDLPCMRTVSGCDMTMETSFPNLFNVGDAVKAPWLEGLPGVRQEFREGVREDP